MQLEKTNAKSGVRENKYQYLIWTHNLKFGMNKIEAISQQKVYSCK